MLRKGTVLTRYDRFFYSIYIHTYIYIYKPLKKKEKGEREREKKKKHFHKYFQRSVDKTEDGQTLQRAVSNSLSRHAFSTRHDAQFVPFLL